MGSPFVVHCKKDAYDVYIGRGSVWGNPYQIGPDGTREQVIKKYEKLMRRLIEGSPTIKKALGELQGKVLGCWCAPLLCHGEVLVKLAKLIKRNKL